MAKSIFGISVTLNRGVKTIIEIAEQLVALYIQMGKMDKFFYNPLVSISHSQNTKMNLLENGMSNIKLLADYILQYNLKDIKQYDKIKHPTINYEREFGFRCYMDFNGLHMQHIMGCNQYSFISSMLSSVIEKDFTWYFSVLKQYVDFFNSTNAVVKITISSFAKESVKYDYPLGWITYFSNDFVPQIPDDLEGFEYEYTSMGKYLIATREDLTANKDVYQGQKEKLVRAMEYLGNAVPGYLASPR
jgi:hypothetical protein